MSFRSTNELIEALTALMGMWLVLYQVPDVVTTYLILLQEPEALERNVFGLYTLRLAMTVLLGITLILARRKVSNWLVKGIPESREIFSLSVLAASFAFLGVYFFVSGLISLGQYYSLESFVGGQAPHSLYQGISSCLCGFVLFVGAPGLTKLWQKIRYAGT